MPDAEKPIIIIKKKGGHGGHHGGAWKVAYADFVTAMMAFFMVMWLLNSAENPTRQAIAYYFRKPGWMQQQSATALGAEGVGILPEAFGPSASERVTTNSKWEERRKTKTTSDSIIRDSKERAGSKGLSKKPSKNNDPNGVIVEKTPERIFFEAPHGSTVRGSSEGAENADSEVFIEPEKQQPEGATAKPTAANGLITPQLQAIKEAFDNIRNIIERDPELREILGEIEIKMDPEGITLEIMDTEKTSMFTPGSTQILPRAELAFSGVVNLLKPLPYPIEVIGHTDATQFAAFPRAMSNWDLSALRANEARKVLQTNGFPADRVLAVIGKADTDLRLPKNPFAAGNRRITIRLKFANQLLNASNGADQLGNTPPDAKPSPQPTPRITRLPVSGTALQPIPTSRPTPNPTSRDTVSLTPRPLAITAQASLPWPQEANQPPRRISPRATPERIRIFPVLPPGQLAQEQIDQSR